eukprot:8333695-Pyramimonas_sp.AAC.1
MRRGRRRVLGRAHGLLPARGQGLPDDPGRSQHHAGAGRAGSASVVLFASPAGEPGPPGCCGGRPCPAAGGRDALLALLLGPRAPRPS